jgi:hypothetical protein
MPATSARMTPRVWFDLIEIHSKLKRPKYRNQVFAPVSNNVIHQSNRLDTDSSAAVRAMASPINVAIDNTRILAATRTASVG